MVVAHTFDTFKQSAFRIYLHACTILDKAQQPKVEVTLAFFLMLTCSLPPINWLRVPRPGHICNPLKKKDRHIEHYWCI